jgi:hypothetical protein
VASPLLVRAGGSSTHASLTTPGPFLHPLVTLNGLKAPTASARKIRRSSDPAYPWVIWWEKNRRRRGFGSPKRSVDAAEGGRGREYGEGRPLPRRERLCLPFTGWLFDCKKDRSVAMPQMAYLSLPKRGRRPEHALLLPQRHSRLVLCFIAVRSGASRRCSGQARMRRSRRPNTR